MSPDFDIDRLLKAVSQFSEKTILVLGDVMLDRFIWGSVRRISPEAPVPVVDVDSETYMLGGAANVLHNLVALGGNAVLCGLVGDDEAGRQVRELLEQLEATNGGLVVSASRPTTIKTRVVAHSQQVVRVDREKRGPATGADLDGLLDSIQRKLPQVDAVIVSDYHKGVINPQVTERLRILCQEQGRPWAVDPKVPNMALYQGADMVTPNHLEAAQSTGAGMDDPDYVQRAGRLLRQRYQFKNVLVTQGELGMTLFTESDETHIPTFARQVFDVTGAGDTVISTLTLGLISGLEPQDAAVLANVAAGVVVGEVGTSAVTAGRLMQAVEQQARLLAMERN